MSEGALVLISFIFTPFLVWASPQSRIILQNDNYVSSSQPYFRDSAEPVSGSVAVGMAGDWRYRNFAFQFLGRDEYAAAERWNYVNVYELAVEYHPSERWTLTLGRKLNTWNEWEGPWHQGIFQPRYTQNKLRTESAGLTGLFLETKRDEWRMTAGLLAHIPDFGAHFFVRDHRFYSANPWFNPPADTFVYNSNLQDIRYSVNKPSPGEVVARPGFAAKSGYRRGLHFLRASFAYKPMPQFLLGFRSRNQVVLGDEVDFMRVRIEPRVAYHRVTSADYSLKSSSWIWSASLTHENPVYDSLSDDFTAQQVGPAWISALQITRFLEEEGPSAARGTLGWLRVQGGDRPDRGDLAGDETLFERRYQYTDAFMFTLSKPFRRGLRFPLEMEARWIYDRLQNGGVFSLSAGRNVSRDMRISLEADFLGLLGRDARVKDGFLSMYRANDRVGMGMSYVF